MDEEIVPLVLRELRFPSRPSIRVGEKIVLYALGHDRVFGIVEAFTKVRQGEGDKPWDRWLMDVREVMSTDYASAPTLAAISTSGRELATSIRQQSHIGLREDEYEAAVRLLRAAGAREDRFYRP
jgi:hypothetical protein